MATTTQVDAVKELQDSFQLLIKNWMLALPTAIAGLLGVVLVMIIFAATVGSVAGGAMLGGGQNSMGAMGAMLGAVGLIGLIGGIIVGLVSLVAHATVIAGADGVWAGKPFDLSTALSTAMGKLPQLILAAILIFLLAIIPGLLIIAAGLGVLLLIALGFFMMYVLPAIVIGNRSATEAIKDSFNLAKANFQPSIIAFIGIIVVVAVASLLNGVFSHVIGLNLVIGFAVVGFAYAFAAIVEVRFYELLSRSSGAVVASTPAPPATP